MKILGIDPGTTTVWFALGTKEDRKFQILDYGVIETTPKLELSKKLLEIGVDIRQLIETHKPERLAIEKLFFNTNITTGIAVSHARWVILYECMRAGLDIYEYTPLQIKKAISWNGQAKKPQVQKALVMLLWLSEIPKPDDAADAIALAYMGSLEN